MIKFFTIIFLLYYIFRVFKSDFMVSTINKITEDCKAFNEAKDDKEKEKIIKTRLVSILGRFILITLFTVPLTIAEAIYIFSAVQYGNKIITIGFIIWWFLILVIGILENKFNKNKFAKIKEFSFIRLFIHIIDVAYFGYMYYILFLV